jgi:serine/threonine-protein phosphatase 5
MAQLPRYNRSELITESFIIRSIECFRDNIKLEKDTILNLIHGAQEIFLSQPTLIEIDPGEGEKVTVCGDIHGEFIANLLCNFLIE